MCMIAFGVIAAYLMARHAHSILGLVGLITGLYFIVGLVSGLFG